VYSDCYESKLNPRQVLNLLLFEIKDFKIVAVTETKQNVFSLDPTQASLSLLIPHNYYVVLYFFFGRNLKNKMAYFIILNLTSGVNS